MKTINQKELEKFSVSELNKILESINEMIMIPIQNVWKLSNKDLKEMKIDVEYRIKEITN